MWTAAVVSSGSLEDRERREHEMCTIIASIRELTYSYSEGPTSRRWGFQRGVVGSQLQEDEEDFTIVI